MFGDLIATWRAAGERGRWTLGDLEWAVRAPGRGNNPWFLKFRAAPADLYRVSYGGKGVRERGTVALFPSSDLEPNS